jgi:hypothetical protein
MQQPNGTHVVNPDERNHQQGWRFSHWSVPVTLTTVARIPYQSNAGFRLRGRDMSKWMSGFSAAWANTNSWLPGATLILGVASLTAIAVGVLWAQSNASEARLAAQSSITKNELTALISEKSAYLEKIIEKTSGEINNYRNEISAAPANLIASSKQALDATNQAQRILADADVRANRVDKLEGELRTSAEKLEANTKDILNVRTELSPITKSLTNSETSLTDLKAELSQSIGKLNSTVSSIKAHEDRHVESYGITPGIFRSGLVNGRIVAFPLANTAAARQLSERSFTRTRARLEATEIYAWVPPGRQAGNLPRVLSQSILTTPFASAPPQ